MNDISKIIPGAKVLVFDSSVFVDDVTTPLSVTMRPATVLRRYGCKSKHFGRYSDLLSVRFDDGSISCGHFIEGVELIDYRKLPDVVDDSILENDGDLISEPPECDCQDHRFSMQENSLHKEWCSSFRIEKICV